MNVAKLSNRAAGRSGVARIQRCDLRQESSSPFEIRVAADEPIVGNAHPFATNCSLPLQPIARLTSAAPSLISSVTSIRR